MPVWRRIENKSFCVARLISFPTTSIFPSLIGSRPIDARPTVVFPEPDSPTRPTISPRKISKLKFLTATNAGIRPRFGYSIVTFSSLRTGDLSVIVSSRFFDDPSFGTAPNSSFVYGCCGRLKIWSALPCSTVTPSFITRISSAISATTPMS